MDNTTTSIDTKRCKICKLLFEKNTKNFYTYHIKGGKYLIYDYMCLGCRRKFNRDRAKEYRAKKKIALTSDGQTKMFRCGAPIPIPEHENQQINIDSWHSSFNYFPIRLLFFHIIYLWLIDRVYQPWHTCLAWSIATKNITEKLC
jgi:hypothetical protein